MLLLLSSGVLGSLLAAEAGCDWALPLLDSEGVGLIFDLALSNATSLVDILTSIGIPADIAQLSLGSEGLGWMAVDGVTSAETLSTLLELTSFVPPLLNQTLDLLSPACELVDGLHEAGIDGLCEQLEAVVDLAVQTLNAPPLYAALQINGSVSILNSLPLHTQPTRVDHTCYIHGLGVYVSRPPLA